MMILRREVDDKEDNIELLLTEMIIDFTGERRVDNYRASIHCTCLMQHWKVGLKTGALLDRM